MKNSSMLYTSMNKVFIVAALALWMISTITAQNLVIQSGGTFENTGTIEVNGNINNNSGSPVSITGTVQLKGATQDIGLSGQALTFQTLDVLGTDTKTMTTNVTVTDALTVNNGAGKLLEVSNKTLTIGGTSTLTSGSLGVSNASSTVVYNGASGSQSVLGLSYGGALTLSGNATKSFGGNASVAGAFAQTGGAVTINNNLTISSATPSFASIADVSAGKSLTLSGTGAKTITTVTDANGTIENTGSSGLLTIGTLSANHGTITGGTGGITFTNAAANAGTITGGAGTITFSSTLAQSGGTITAGSGDINFVGAVTRTGGSIASSAAANVLNFESDLNGSAGTIDLTSTGAAEFGGAVASANGLNFATGTTVTYDGSSSQAIADVNYGYLTLKNSAKTWTLGAARTINNDLDVQSSSATTVNGSFDLTVLGNVSLASNVTKSANAVLFTNASSAVSGSGYEIVGAVTRTHTFAEGTPYTFNNARMVVTPTTVTNLESFTMNSQPGTSPTGYQIGNSVNRTYVPTYTGTGFTASVQLSYLSGEYTGSISDKLKLFQNGISKDNKLNGTYTRNSGDGFSYVALAGLTQASLASGQQLALDDRFNMLIVATNWTDQGTPTATDDVEVDGDVTIDGTGSFAANSVTINSGKSLTVGGTNTTSLSVGAGGLTNNSNVTTGGLDVKSNGTVTVNGNLTNAGKIKNAGTIKVE